MQCLSKYQQWFPPPRNGKTHPKIYMGFHGTPNTQNNLRKKNQVSGLPHFKTNYKATVVNQNSVVLVIRQTYRQMK